jgi:DeoR/GlpR family transcriptional regulator of sugar metabolism
MENEQGLGQQPLPLRREAIYQLIKNEGVVRVNDLAERLGVTSMTIRRDLETLERDGLIERVHGGAVPTKQGLQDPFYTQKSVLHQKEKSDIATFAAGLIEDGDTVFLNSGTTTLRIFRLIHAKQVKVITNNPCFIMEDIPDDVDVICTGGIFRKQSFTLIGDTAMSTIAKVNATKAFIGLDGFDLEHGITTPVQDEAIINRLMIEHTTGKVIVVADSSKIGRVASFFVAPANKVHALITDSKISTDSQEALIQAGLTVYIV